MRVLVVEDELALRENLRRQLVEAGFNVDVAADGEEGLFAGNEYPIDVAIIDLGLPKLPGLELIRRLRAQDRRFPILVLTARDRWQDKVEGLDAGADDYVAKPSSRRYSPDCRRCCVVAAAGHRPAWPAGPSGSIRVPRP